MSKKAKINVVYFVVGDKKLNSGNGIYVKILEEMKASLINIKQASQWQLVISIHGSEEHLSYFGAQSPKGDTLVFYDADKIRELFNEDNNFNKWRETYGPTWTTLNACQVHMKFEEVIIKALNKPKSKQKAQGLGSKCHPLTTTWIYLDITTRNQMTGFDKKQRDEFNDWLKDKNKKYGYFGKPVQDPLLEQYYFDEPPKGGWPVMTVAVEGTDTQISFYNRTHPDNYTKFIEVCPNHMGPILRSRTSAVPPVGDI